MSRADRQLLNPTAPREFRNMSNLSTPRSQVLTPQNQLAHTVRNKALRDWNSGCWSSSTPNGSGPKAEDKGSLYRCTRSALSKMIHSLLPASR